MGFDVLGALDSALQWVGDRLEDADCARDWVGGQVEGVADGAERHIDGFRRATSSTSAASTAAWWAKRSRSRCPTASA